MPDKVTVPRLRAMRSKGERIVCVTAYDAAFGAIADEAGVDLILVGDSLGNVLLGYESTVPVTLEQMVHHTRATRAGVSRALLVADLPFGSYQSSVAQAVDSAVALMKAGAEAVKLEGAYVDEIRAIAKAGIPVMGHAGMTPQSFHAFGGFRVQGKGAAGAAITEQVAEIAEAGAFSVVLELVPAELASHITRNTDTITIGIGAGCECSGQIQVINDILGLSVGDFKHSKKYVDGRNLLGAALREYASDVRQSQFPSKEQSF